MRGWKRDGVDVDDVFPRDTGIKAFKDFKFDVIWFSNLVCSHIGLQAVKYEMVP